MNFFLLKKIERVKNGIIATVLNTQGHSYKKKGEKALFSANCAFPVYGNLGPGCINEEIVLKGKEVIKNKKPCIIKINTSKFEDIHFGYGAYCGGVMEVLIEPILEKYKKVYKLLKEYLKKEKSVFLIHNLKSCEISISEKFNIIERHRKKREFFIERINPLIKLFIFGATPLCHNILKFLEDMDFEVNIIDWRKEYLKTFKELFPFVGLFYWKRNTSVFPFSKNSFILILSHNFLKDKEILKTAIQKKCRYIGLLSSKKRKERIFKELIKEGIKKSELQKISSPVGLNISSKTDSEIAISIVGELIKMKNSILSN